MQVRRAKDKHCQSLQASTALIKRNFKAGRGSDCKTWALDPASEIQGECQK